VAGGAAFSAAAAWHRQRTGRGGAAVGAGLAGTVALLVAAGHLGATLTHGEGYLLDAAPAPVRDAVRSVIGPATVAAHTGPAERAPIYPALVRPILTRRCVACHSPGASRGGLALDTPEGILAGGDHGPAVVPGRALASDLVRRVWLPPDHPEAMPPRPQRPLAAADAAILRWWIDAGAPFDRTVGEVEIAPDVMPILEARLGPIARGGPPLPEAILPPPDPARIEVLRSQGVDVRPVAAGSPFLEVRIGGGTAGGAADDARVAALRPVAPHVAWLTLAGASLGEQGFAAIGALPNLTRLDLSRTAADDATLATLGALERLDTLNLYGTRVGDAGLERIAAWPRLRRVYLWRTDVTAAGVERLRAAAPRLEVVTGEELENATAATRPGPT
jgi:hypothetical protein